MAVDDKEQDKPLKRPPPPRQQPPQPLPQPPPPPQYQQPLPPPPPPAPYPMPPATVRTQRSVPPPQYQPLPPPPPLVPQPQQEAPPVRKPLKQTGVEKTQPLPLVGMVVALMAALMGIITAVLSMFNEALSIPLLAVAIAGTNAALIVVAMAIWRLLTRR
jgi:protein TonB